MDPIKDGNTIFREIGESIGGKSLISSRDIHALLQKLFDRTQGLVIVDFLDTGSWDKIEAFEIDPENFLMLTWHDYRRVSEGREAKEIRQAAFPASRYLLSIKVNSVVPVKVRDTYVYLINGFAMTEKEIKKKWGHKAEEYKAEQNHFFEIDVYRKTGGTWEVINCHTTPIFSIAILPKSIGLGSFDSKNILYWKNLSDGHARLMRVLTDIDTITNVDEICSKANTIRRVLESVLKIECCYREIVPRKGYSQLLLGDLIHEVSHTKTEDERKELNQLARDLNEHSHDTGIPVDKTIITESAKRVTMYIKRLAHIFQD